MTRIAAGVDTVRRLTPHRAKMPARAAILKAIELAGTGTLPDALIIGAQRSGTTSFHDYVTRHSGVRGGRLTKEVRFFDRNWDRGTGWYRRYFPSRSTRLRFARRHGYEMVAVDATPDYLVHPAVPGRVAEVSPDVRLIAVLRNPIDRALSQYRLEVKHGYEDARTFEEALDRETDRLHGEEGRLLEDDRYVSHAHLHYSYVLRGHYMRQLERWLDIFPRDRLLVLVSEDIFSDPHGQSRRVFDFLEVPQLELGRLSRLSPSRTGDTISPKTRARLQTEFRESNEALYAFLGRDLGWA